MNQNLTPGDIVQHFKRQDIEDKSQPTFLYKIIAFAKHSETQEPMVVYQALYGEQGVWVRPYEMFMGEVDREKYPDSKQKYRFELVDWAEVNL